VVMRVTTTWRIFAGLTRLATNNQTVLRGRDRDRLHRRIAIYHLSRFHRCSRCSRCSKGLRRMAGDT
jgi:hypothetical protein